MTNNTNPTAPHSSTDEAYANHPITHNCDDCFDYAGHENSHSDQDHDSLPVDHEDRLNCRVCTADYPRPLRKATSHEGAKGVHINHSACYAKDLHTKDRDGRQHCRDTELYKKA